jgi:hypothetical protein
MRSHSSGKGQWGEVLDPLTEVLQDLHLSGCFYCRSELRAPWGLEIPPRDFASFHFVAEGGCWLRGALDAPLQLAVGDLVLFPRGRGHALADVPDGPAHSIHALPHEKIGQNAAILRHGGDGERTLLICGGVRLDHPAVHPLVALMPDLVHVRATGGADEQLLRDMLAAMGTEALALKPGGATVMNRLADIPGHPRHSALAGTQSGRTIRLARGLA